MGWWGPL